MYIVTFIQSDSNNIDSSLCRFTQDIFKKVQEFFKDSLLDGLQECEVLLTEGFASKKEDFSLSVGCYMTIHVQALNAYSRQQLSLINQQTPLAPIKPYKIILNFKNGEESVQRYYETLEDAKWAFNTFYMRRPNKDEIEYKAEGWDLEEKPQEPLKPFVVAATLPDNTEVVLGRFDTEAEQRMFYLTSSLWKYNKTDLEDRQRAAQRRFEDSERAERKAIEDWQDDLAAIKKY